MQWMQQLHQPYASVLLTASQQVEIHFLTCYTLDY